MWIAEAIPMTDAITMDDQPTPTSSADEGSIDHELMASIAGGDHLAFRRLVERHQNLVVGTVAKMLGNPTDAEDISQQVFLRIWRHAKRYKPEAKFTTYLFTITRNLVFNEVRRRGRKNEVSSNEREENSHWEVEERSEYQPDEELMQAELQKAVDEAIASLPENQRLAVVMRRYQQASYEEIAQVLEMSLPAVKSLIFRARGALREALGRYLEP